MQIKKCVPMALFLACCSLHADLLTMANNGGNPTMFTGTCIASTSYGTSEAHVSATCPLGAGGRTYSEAVDAYASYGSVAGKFYNSYTNGAVFQNFTATAEFNDSFWISGFDQTAHLQYMVDYDGDVDNHAESRVGGGFQWYENGQMIGSLLGIQMEYYTGSPINGIPLHADGRYLYTGRTVVQSGDLISLRGLLTLVGGDELPTADIRGTLIGIRAIGADGSVLPAVFTFSSPMTTFTDDAFPTPEPLSMATVGGGLVLLIGWRRRCSSVANIAQ